MPPKTRSSPKQKAEETSFEDSKENLKVKSEETNERENFATPKDCPNGKEATKIGSKRKRQPSKNQDTNVEVSEEQHKTKKEPPKTRLPSKQKAVKKGSKRKGQSSGNEDTSFEDSKENLKDKSEETNERENFATQKDCPNGKEATKIGSKRKRQPSKNQDTNVEVSEEQPKTKKEPPKTRLPSKQKAVKKGSKRKGQSSGNEDTSFEDSKENLKDKSEETNERENFATQKDCPNGKEATKIGSKRKRQPSKNQDTNVEVSEEQPKTKKEPPKTRLPSKQKAVKKGSKRKGQSSGNEDTSFEDSKENLKDKSEETNERENFATQKDCPNGKEATKIGSKRKRQPSKNQDTNVEVSEEQPKTKKEPPKTRLPSKQKAVKKGSKRKGQSSGNEDTSFEDSKENLKDKSEETNERENFATQKDCPNGKEATKIGSKRKRQPSKNQDTNVEVPEDQPESKKKGTNKRENLANGKEATKKGSKRKEQTSEIKDKDSQSDNIGNITTENEYGKYQKYNKDKLWKLKKIPHHILPSFNISKNTDIKNVRDFPLIQISLPHSVYVNPKFSEDIDFCHRRTIALNSYMTRLKAVKTGYFSAKKKSKSLRKNENKGIYCKQLIDFAERREFHPDKYFMQDYDFYYTGGNLCINNQTNQIAHVAGTKMNTLVLSVFNVQHNIPKVHRLTTVEFKNSGDDECEIFEVQTSSSKEEFFFLRQKHCVSIQEFSSGKMNVVQNFKTKDVPFISFTQDLVNTHHLAISDLVHKVRVCDLEKGVPIQTLRLMPREQIKSANNWNMIKSMDSFVYIYSASKKVSIIDTRLPESEWKSNYSGISEENSCNNFCSLARSKFENLFYVGSSHKAYCVDRRYMGKDVDSRNAVVACWTHQMSTFPLIMATTCINDSEYIALQSPVSSDLRICENMQFMDKTESNTVTEYSYKSPSLPYMPPSIESVFQEARVQGKCAKPSTGMCDRVKACITGLCFTDDRPSSYLLTATSNGDIFARHIHNPELDVKPDTATAFQVMSEFEDNICRSVRKIPLAITEVCNLAGISKVFRCPHLSGLQKEEDFDFSSKRKYMGRWQKSIETLSKYKDALATDLISIWDFDIEEGRDLNITSLNKTEVSDSKVSGWLENIPEIENTTIFNMTSIPMDVLNASNLNDTIADTSFNENDQTNNKSNIDLDKSVRTVKPKTAKKKSRYIKGF